MHSSGFLCSLLAVSALTETATSLPSAFSSRVRVKSISTVFQFGYDAEIENLAIRPNGNILFTEPAPGANVWEIDPSIANGSAILRKDFPDVTTALGVSSIGPDTFAITTGDVGTGFAGEVGTFAVHVLRYTSENTSQTAGPIHIPGGKLVNKITAFDPPSDVILVSDPESSHVLSVNLKTGAIKTVLHDAETMNATTNFPIGVNGIRTAGKYLYYINTAKALLSRVAVNRDGTAAGPYEIVANISSTLLEPDDFAVLPSGDAFIAGSNEIVHVQPDGKYSVLAGGEHQLQLAGATSALFGVGCKSNILYVSTTGHGSAPGNTTFLEPGKIVAIEVSGL
ncbi:hypothetical protein NFIA_026140 [Paecilomyces variotii No. 5]|uniref:SMP-30/Gluconolactonase/LRE-like region domain-containing protein n=1 Tax=Byssochlamys spectabilis (strain No. 5 / NBRC 109023) TaxID=1356009 RepID=V5I4H3_BYSSN|nr:hypothetical protein NFIA_026140 [Paecilomyces variotii No. 5]